MTLLERLWQRSIVKKFSGTQLCSVVFSPDSNMLYGGAFTQDGMVRLIGEYCKIGKTTRPWHFLWNPTTGELSATEPPLENVSPDGRLYVKRNGGGHQSRPPLGTVFDANTHQKLCDLEGRAGYE